MSGRMDSSGISTVVGLILVLALIISVAAVIKITFVPDVKKQLEADHMQHVIADFSAFKTQLDMDQAASAATGVGYAASASVEMGGGAIPGIDPSSSYGTLSLDPSYGRLTVTAYDYMSGARLNLGTATALGRLIFQSNNRYYADQNLSYECGMVLLSQPGGSIMLAPPSLTVSADPNVAGRPIVSMNAIRLNGTPQSFSSSGTGTIRTSLMPGSTAYAGTNITNVTFTIVSDYAPQWYDYLRGMLANSGLAAGNYALTRPDARTVVLRVNGTGSQSTGLFLADSSFGTAMGYSTTPPGQTTTPTPTPSPIPGSGLAANFQGTPTSGSAPLTVQFSDLSTGSPVAWQWNFGDGSGNMTVPNGPHTFTAAGTYPVTLTIYNSTSSSTMQKVGYIRVNNTLALVSSSVTQVSVVNNGSGGMKTYTLSVSIRVRNDGPGRANSVLATCVPPADVGGDGPTYIKLISSPSSNPRNINSGSSVTFTWRYQLDKKQSVKPITFTLSAAGSNTNIVVATPQFNS